MSRMSERRDGRYLILLGAAIFLLIGFTVEHQGDAWMEDFKALYFNARCLIEHHDLYVQAEVLKVYAREGNERATDAFLVGQRAIVTINVYPPPTFLVAAPFALLGWNAAHLLWMALIASCFVLSAFLAWDLAADYQPLLSGSLIGFTIADNFTALLTGNPGGIVVSLCVIAVWCFLRARWAAVGVLGLAICLAIKPHDAWLILLWLLTYSGTLRKRGLQTIGCAFVIAIPAFVWIANVSPNWLREMSANLAVVSGPIGINNPAPSSLSTHTAGMIIDMQTIFSVFRDDPRFYNLASYAFSCILIGAWLYLSLRKPVSPKSILLSLAAGSALTMLPVYHRTYDAHLLLLTLPALAILWSEGGAKKWLALVVTAAGLLGTGDVVLATLVWATDKLHFSLNTISGQMRFILFTRPVPLILVSIACFYLWHLAGFDRSGHNAATDLSPMSGARQAIAAEMPDAV